MLGVLDSGALSLLAAYVMMRRGCLTQLLIPCSTTDPRFEPNRQVEFARKIRKFVTRENYPCLILQVDEVPQGTSIIRHIGLELAKKRRFRGLVLADIGGTITIDGSLSRRSQVLDLPIFQPLIGFTEVDLQEFSQVLGVDWRDNPGNTHFHSIHSSDAFDVSNMPITEVSL